jgi:hypothetical protein
MSIVQPAGAAGTFGDPAGGGDTPGAGWGVGWGAGTGVLLQAAASSRAHASATRRFDKLIAALREGRKVASLLPSQHLLDRLLHVLGDALHDRGPGAVNEPNWRIINWRWHKIQAGPDSTRHLFFCQIPVRIYLTAGFTRPPSRAPW